MKIKNIKKSPDQPNWYILTRNPLYHGDFKPVRNRFYLKTSFFFNPIRAWFVRFVFGSLRSLVRSRACRAANGFTMCASFFNRRRGPLVSWPKTANRWSFIVVVRTLLGIFVDTVVSFSFVDNRFFFFSFFWWEGVCGGGEVRRRKRRRAEFVFLFFFSRLSLPCLYEFRYVLVRASHSSSGSLSAFSHPKIKFELLL